MDLIVHLFARHVEVLFTLKDRSADCLGSRVFQWHGEVLRLICLELSLLGVVGFEADRAYELLRFKVNFP